MIKKGFIYLDLLCLIILITIGIPVLLKSMLHLMHLNIVSQNVLFKLFELNQLINMSSNSSTYIYDANFLNSFNLYKYDLGGLKVYWIHAHD